MVRKLSDSVVVITGASSGIGRAAALRFARAGAALVLAARREKPLREAVRECERLGAQAIAVPTDVTDEKQVEALARRAVETFGRIDTWVNNAGVYALARFEELPRESLRRVVETNFFGVTNGCAAALPYLREQGEGIVINVGSLFSCLGAPYLSAYVASKYAVRGFSECLRQEVQSDGIHVCCIMPAAIDTPLYDHTANYTGRAAQPIRPIYSVDDAARAIVSCASRPRREVFVGSFAPIARAIHAIVPKLHEAVMPRRIEHGQFRDEPQEPTAGNLFQPVARGTQPSGGWLARRERRRSAARAGGERRGVSRKHVLLAAATVGAPIATYFLSRSIQGRIALAVGRPLLARAMASLGVA